MARKSSEARIAAYEKLMVDGGSKVLLAREIAIAYRNAMGYLPDAAIDLRCSEELAKLFNDVYEHLRPANA